MNNTGYTYLVILLIIVCTALFYHNRINFKELAPQDNVVLYQANEEDESIDEAITKAHNTQVDISNIYVPVVYDLSIRNYEQICIKVKRITAYNALANQTDSHPFTMASNRPVYEGAVAISQDIIDKYKLQYGDIVYIKSLDSYYIFEDKMAYGRKENEKII